MHSPDAKRFPLPKELYEGQVFPIVGSGTNMYDLSARVWGRPGCNEGKDIRDVCFSNYFLATLGINFGMNSTSTVAQYEQIQALSVGVGATYMLDLNQDWVESSPQKYAIFKAVRTWENARAARAFPNSIKKYWLTKHCSFIWNKQIMTTGICLK